MPKLNINKRTEAKSTLTLTEVKTNVYKICKICKHTCHKNNRNT